MFSKKSSTRKFFLYTNNNDKLDENNLKFYSSFTSNLDELKLILNSKISINSGIRGIKNLGNTCSINTIISSLSNCPDLVYYILSKKYKNDLNPKSMYKNALANAFFNLIETNWTGVSLGGNLDTLNNNLNPKDLKTIIAAFGNQFIGSNQQDPHEFLILLLDALNSELSVKSDIVGSLVNKLIVPKGDDETELNASKRFWKNHKIYNSSIIPDLSMDKLKRQ